MYPFIQKFHSGWAYLALLLLVVSVVVAALGFFSKKEFTAGNRKIALFALIGTHIQLLVGLVLYFQSPLGFALLGEMKDKAIRLTSLEHPLINIIAIVLITIGWSKHKRGQDSQAKFKSIFVFYGLGLLLILSRIPWSLWF
jgi:NADH:ubiquinone oxidoreductase subunit 2 (subunit N)